MLKIFLLLSIAANFLYAGSSAALVTLAATTLPSPVQVPIKVEQPLPLMYNGLTAIPNIGFGTWNLNISPENTSAAVSLAIQHGYRHIDCGTEYGNQKAVGEGIAQGLVRCKMTREDIWVSSKLWNDDHGSEARVEQALDSTLQDLGVGYLDLWLMHWPVGMAAGDANAHEEFLQTWHSMETLVTNTSKVRRIGISNFSPEQVRVLVSRARILPVVHQMELHPYLQQSDWVEFHKQYGIVVTAYSPLANADPTYWGDETTPGGDDLPEYMFTKSGGKKHAIQVAGRPVIRVKGDNSTTPLLFDNAEMKKIAQRRNCTVAQVALAWGIGRGTVVIPKSSHEDWIVENLNALDCELWPRDIDDIRQIGRKYLTRFNNPSADWGVRLFEGLDGA